MLNHPGQVVGLRHISKIFCESYLKAATPKNAISCFRKTSIVPFNPNIFDDSDFAPAQTTNIVVTSLDNVTQPRCSDDNTANVIHSTTKPIVSAYTLNTEHPAEELF